MKCQYVNKMKSLTEKWQKCLEAGSLPVTSVTGAQLLENIHTQDFTNDSAQANSVALSCRLLKYFINQPLFNLAVSDICNSTLKKTKAEWSLELAEDLQTKFGMDIDAEMVNILGESVGSEIYVSILDEARGWAINTKSKNDKRYDYIVCMGEPPNTFEYDKFENPERIIVGFEKIGTRDGKDVYLNMFKTPDGFLYGSYTNKITYEPYFLSKIDKTDKSVTVFTQSNFKTEGECPYYYEEYGMLDDVR